MMREKRVKRQPIQAAVLTKEDKKAFNRELLTLAVPLALQNLLVALVGASDALMLGRLNQASIAAVSLFNGAVIGAVGVLVAQYMGKGDTKNAKRFLAMAIRYSVGISLVFFLLALLIPEHVMAVFTQDREMIEIGAGYLRIVGFSYVFSGIAQRARQNEPLDLGNHGDC